MREDLQQRNDIEDYSTYRCRIVFNIDDHIFERVYKKNSLVPG